MLANFFTISFALTTVLAQLVLAAEDFNLNCEEYRKFVENEFETFRFDEHKKMSNTLESIRIVEGCKVDIRIAIELEHKCHISAFYQIFQRQISFYVNACTDGSYLTQFHGEPAPEKGGQSEVDAILPKEFIAKYRARIVQSCRMTSRVERRELRTEITEEELTSIFMNIVKEVGIIEPKAMEAVVQERCKKLLDYYEKPMIWIDRALTVVRDSCRYLNRLPDKTRNLFLQSTICKGFMVSSETAMKALSDRFNDPGSFGMTKNYDLLQ